MSGCYDPLVRVFVRFGVRVFVRGKLHKSQNFVEIPHAALSGPRAATWAGDGRGRVPGRGVASWGILEH